MFIKRNYLISVILLLAFSIFVASCTSLGESARDLSTPSKRLVGHWGVYRDGIYVAKDEFSNERWFGELNEDGIGSFSINSGGTAAGIREINSSQYYVVLSENGDTVTIGHFLGEVPPDPFPQELVVSFEVTKDGQKLRMVGSKAEFQYIDYKTEP